MPCGKSALLLTLLTALLGSTVFAQDHPPIAAAARLAPPEPILNVVRLAGLPEVVFDALLESDKSASFHYGSTYDTTYKIDGAGLLTVQFHKGKAGLFRLIVRRGCASAEVLPLMLGVDTAQLELAEAIDVKKVWRGPLGDVPLVEVAVIYSPSGWTTAVVKVASHAPHRE